MKRYALALILLFVICIPGLAMADLSGPTPGTSYNGTSYSGFGNFVNGGTAVNIGTTFIYSTDNTPVGVGIPFASGNLNWAGTDAVTLSFDYTLSGDAGSANYIAYGFNWTGSGPTSITTYGSGHISETFNLAEAQANGDSLSLLAYADGMNAQANISNITVSSTPIPAAVWLFGSGLMGLMGLRRKQN
jgi:hypothetical protein